MSPTVAWSVPRPVSAAEPDRDREGGWWATLSDPTQDELRRAILRIHQIRDWAGVLTLHDFGKGLTEDR